MRNRLLATTIICGAAFAALPALAQDAKGDVEEIIVTGSRIPQTNLQITSPVTQISA
jgi:outer membrane cobalamin receptor